MNFRHLLKVQKIYHKNNICTYCYFYAEKGFWRIIDSMLPMVSVTDISPVGLIGTAIFANLFPGVPEEIFLLSFGYFAHIHPDVFSFWRIVIFLIIGFCAIDSVVYYLAMRGNKVIKFLTEKVLGVELHGREEFLAAHVQKIIFISRFLAQFRIIGPATAGMIRYPYRKFLLINFWALCVYVPLVMGVGYYFADRVQYIITGTHVVRNVMLSVLAVIAFVILFRQLRKALMKFLSGDTGERIKSFLGISRIPEGGSGHNNHSSPDIHTHI